MSMPNVPGLDLSGSLEDSASAGVTLPSLPNISIPSDLTGVISAGASLAASAGVNLPAGLPDGVEGIMNTVQGMLSTSTAPAPPPPARGGVQAVARAVAPPAPAAPRKVALHLGAALAPQPAVPAVPAPAVAAVARPVIVAPPAPSPAKRLLPFAPAALGLVLTPTVGMGAPVVGVTVTAVWLLKKFGRGMGLGMS